MSAAEFLHVFLKRGIDQPILPPELGINYPIWAFWLIAGFGLLSQFANEPRTDRQRRVRSLVIYLFSFAIIYGLVVALSFTRAEVLE